MTPDLQSVIDGVLAQLPDVEWCQLQVKHPADDDGLWFFWRRGRRQDDVQIESSYGTCPFLVEGLGDGEVRRANTPAETIATIVDWLS